MRGLTSWKQHFRYKRYLGSTFDVDDDGYHTGEPKDTYSDFIDGYANISGAGNDALGVRKSAYESPYGLSVEYNKVIFTTEDLGIDEHTKLWIDDLESDKPDYVVTRIARSVHGHYRIAIARINT